MSFVQKIAEDLRKAIKAKETVRISCLRLLKTSIKNREIEKGHELKDEEIQSIISSSIRKGQEAVKEFRQGGREDLAAKEEAEIGVLYGYLPEQLSPEEIEKTLREIISELSAESPNDLGKIMKVAMARMAGKAQGREVSEIAKRLLV